MRQRSKSLSAARSQVVESDSESEPEFDEYSYDEEAMNLDTSINTSDLWSKEDTLALIVNIEKNFKENNKSYTNALKKLNWSKVATTRSPEDTKSYFKKYIHGIRKVRTLTEVLADAKELFDKPNKFIHPYNLWLKENYPKLREELQTTSIAVISKLAGQRFALLSPEEKAIYTERANIGKVAKPIKSVTKVTPFKLFYQHHKENTKSDEKVNFKLIRAEWGKLSFKQKTKWIKKVLLNSHEYDKAIPFLSKEEKKILENVEKKPTMPLNSYDLFKQDFQDDISDLNFIEQTKIYSEHYRKLPESKRLKYDTKAQAEKDKYIKELAEWIKGLSEDRRKIELMELSKEKSSYNRNIKKKLLSHLGNLYGLEVDALNKLSSSDIAVSVENKSPNGKMSKPKMNPPELPKDLSGKAPKNKRKVDDDENLVVLNSPKKSKKTVEQQVMVEIPTATLSSPITASVTQLPSKKSKSPSKMTQKNKIETAKIIKSEPLPKTNEVKGLETKIPAGMPEFNYNNAFEYWNDKIYKGKSELAADAFKKLSQKTVQKHTKEFQAQQSNYLKELHQYLSNLPAKSLLEYSRNNVHVKIEKEVDIPDSEHDNSCSESDYSNSD